MSEKDQDIKYMKNLLNQRSETESSQADSQPQNKLDYSHPHAEIINLIQSLIEGELVDGAENDNLQDKFYTWLADYKELHSLDDFSLLVKELQARFDSQRKTNYKVKLLFEVLEELSS